MESVDLGLSIAISDVNEDQTIEAPADALPLEDLLGQLGGLGALGGLEGLDGAGLDLGGGGPAATSGGGGGGGAEATVRAPTSSASPRRAATRTRPRPCLDEL